MLIGIVAGILAGAAWGLTFVAPHVVAPYSPFDLTVLRYAAFAAASAAILAWRSPAALRSLTAADALLFTALGFSGYAGYFLCMALAVPRVGTAIVALIIGALPVILALLGNRGPTAKPLGQLALPLACIVAGLAVVNVDAFLTAGTPADRTRLMVGIALTVAALALWTWYAIANARAMQERPHVDAITWTGLTGLGTAAATLPIAVLGWLGGLSEMPMRGLWNADGMRLIAWGVILGFVSSWLATWAWSIASQRLPVSLTGQLIVSETLFALLYGFIYEQRWPTTPEWLGSTFLIAGVILAIRVFSGPKYAHA
jgi:drug/metabolite transporter (DMT)-like permease